MPALRPASQAGPMRNPGRHHPPCVGFDKAAVGLLQLGVREPAAVDCGAVIDSAERRCSACV